jgi:hypothetical protein
MTKETKEIAVQENSAVVSVENLIGQAITAKATVETLEKLLAMRRELKAEAAKEQFDTAMAMFQNECPIIKKAKAGGKTNSGVTGYYYAPLDTIVQQTKALIMKHGFSYSIQTETRNKDKEVVAKCIVRHNAGHSESSDMTVPLGGKTGIMSDTQVVAAAITFAKRYAFCNAFGILTGDPDTDGPAPTGNPRALFDKAIALLNSAKTPEALEQIWKFKIRGADRADDEVIAFKNQHPCYKKGNKK